jgi:hypothetical protein
VCSTDGSNVLDVRNPPTPGAVDRAGTNRDPSLEAITFLGETLVDGRGEAVSSDVDALTQRALVEFSLLCQQPQS